MATTLASLASKYDPSSPDYDPTAATQATSAAPSSTDDLNSSLTPPATPSSAAGTTPTSSPAPSGGITAAPNDPVAQAQAIANANKATATTQQYDESTGVAGRVNSLVSADSPLMQTARTQAAQAANARGLVNSSLGVQAGEQAVINTATPIAQTDAQLTSAQNLANQAATNNASTTNAQVGAQLGSTGMSLAQQASQFQVTSGQTATQLAQAQENIDNQMSQFAQSLGLNVQDLQLRRDTLTVQQQQALDQLNLQKAQLSQQQAQFTSAQNLQASQFAATQQQQLVMQAADNETKTAIEQMDASYKSDIQSNLNISQAWGTMMQGISAIQNNSALDGVTKTTLIQNTINGFASFADFWKGTTNTDVTSLLNFGVTSAGTANPDGSTNQPAVGGDFRNGVPVPVGETGGGG